MKNIMRIAFVIIGTLVGAGFASGKEIFSFFFIYGKGGVLGIFVSCMIIGLVIYRVFSLCNRYSIESYQGFCEIIEKNKLINRFQFQDKKIRFSKLLNNIVNIFLLITFYVMISGFSSFLNQEFHIIKVVGSIMITIPCYFIFLKNINGLVKISNYLIPVSIVFIVFISSKSINIKEDYNYILNLGIIGEYSMFEAVLNAVLYACYNCIILIPVLIPFRKLINSNKYAGYISVVCFFILLILSFSIFNLLLQGNTQSLNLEMPIIEIAEKFGKFYRLVYTFIIGISVFTTAVSSGCGFLNNCCKNKKVFKRNLCVMLVTGVFFSQVSFSALVNLLYPVLGVLGLIEIILIFDSSTVIGT